MRAAVSSACLQVPFEKDGCIYLEGNPNPAGVALDEVMAITGAPLRDSVALLVSIGSRSQRLNIESMNLMASGDATHQAVHRSSLAEKFPYVRIIAGTSENGDVFEGMVSLLKKEH